ncbi:uncharacterized [Tachysurus ichikawai]
MRDGCILPKKVSGQNLVISEMAGKGQRERHGLCYITFNTCICNRQEGSGNKPFCSESILSFSPLKYCRKQRSAPLMRGVCGMRTRHGIANKDTPSQECYWLATRQETLDTKFAMLCLVLEGDTETGHRGLDPCITALLNTIPGTFMAIRITGKYVKCTVS